MPLQASLVASRDAEITSPTQVNVADDIEPALRRAATNKSEDSSETRAAAPKTRLICSIGPSCCKAHATRKAPSKKGALHRKETARRNHPQRCAREYGRALGATSRGLGGGDGGAAAPPRPRPRPAGGGTAATAT